jgi:hypothetical protein
MSLAEAIKTVIEAGLEVHHAGGGYVCRRPDWSKPWLHQTNFRSSDDYAQVEDAIRAFLGEAGVDDGY